MTKIICKRIKKRRAELDMTQEDLAEKVGVSRVYIGYVEQGRNTPSLEILEKIAKGLKTKLSDLLELIFKHWFNYFYWWKNSWIILIHSIFNVLFDFVTVSQNILIFK